MPVRTFQSLVVMLPRAYPSKFIFLLENFHYFSFFFFFLLEMPFVLGFTFLEFIQVQFLTPSLWTRYTYSCLYWLFITKGFLDGGRLPLVFMNECLLPFSFFIWCRTCYVFCMNEFSLICIVHVILWFKCCPSTCKTLSSSLII